MTAENRDTRILSLIAISSDREATARLREQLFGLGTVVLSGVFERVEDAAREALTKRPDALLVLGERSGEAIARLSDLPALADLPVIDIGPWPGVASSTATKAPLLDALEGLRRDTTPSRSIAEGVGLPAVGPRGLVTERRVDRIAVRSEGRIHLVAVEEIAWVDAVHNAVRLYTRSGELRLRRSISSLAADLDPSRFLRIHRSTIINLSAVKEFRIDKRGQYAAVMPNGTILTVSRSFREALLARLSNMV